MNVPRRIFDSPRTAPQEFDRRRLVLLGFSGCAHDGLVADLEAAKATKRNQQLTKLGLRPDPV
jgi:hypothetical protein